MEDNQLKGKKVLITGGLGFIGSNLAIRLVEIGAKVTLIDSLIPQYGGNFWNIEPIKDQVRVNISDVRDPHSLKYLIADQDYLFNLAGQTSHMDSMEDPETDLEINVHAQLTILEACRKHNPGIKLVFASTRQIYGKPIRLPVDESHPLSPVDVNGINKLAGEQYHILYNNVYGIRAAILRLTNTYGPRMRVKDARQTFLGIWIKRLIDGHPIAIFGDGKQLRDFNYVEDVVDALLMTALSEKSNGEIYNLGSEETFNLTQTAELLLSLHEGGQLQYVPFPESRKAIDIGDYCGDFSKIREHLEWSPKISLREGAQRTLDFYKQYHQHYW